MSLDINSTLLSLLQAEEAKARKEGLGGANPDHRGGLDFPYADPNDWSDGISFDTNIPRLPDGSVDVNALLERLRKILYYSNQGDPMDFNSQLDLVAFLMNIAGVWGELNSQQKGQIDQFLHTPYGKSGKSLIEQLSPDMIESLIYGYFYKHGGDKKGTEEFAKNLIDKLGELLGGGADFLGPLFDHAQQIGNTSALDAWMKQHIKNGKPDMDFDDFAFLQAFKWELEFSMNPESEAYFNEIRHNEIEELTKNVKDVFLLYILLMMILVGENGDLQMQIGGRGNLINALTKGLGALGKKIYSQWTGGHFTGDSVKEFFENLYKLEALCKDKRFGSLQDTVDKVFKDFFDAKNGITVKDPVTGKDTTLGELYQKIQSGAAGYSWDTMATALNNLAPSTQYPPVTPPGYTEITNDMGTIVNAVTNVSTVQGQIMQNLEGINEKDLALLTAGFNSVTNLNKIAVQNMSAARG